MTASSEQHQVMDRVRAFKARLSDANDLERIKFLHDTKVLEGFEEDSLQQMAEIAACIAGVPMAFVAFIDQETTHVVAGQNSEKRSDDRFETLCGYVISDANDVTIVEDIFTDERFDHISYIGEKRNFRFYAGAPIVAPGGVPIGTLCTLDTVPRRLTDQQIKAIRSLAQAITPRLQLALSINRLRESENKFQLFMDNSPMTAFIKNETGQYEYVNRRVLEHFKLTKDQIIGKTDRDLWSADLADKLMSNDKEVFKTGSPTELIEPGPADEHGDTSWWQSHKFLLDQESKLLGGIAIDITSLKLIQSKLESLANKDALTGLLNRRALMHELGRAIHQSKFNRSTLAVIYLDVDKFKEVNDTFGHAVGDKLLIELSRRLKQQLRDSDLVARIGGDEFVLVIENLKNAEDASRIAHKIFERVTSAQANSDFNHDIPVSLGVAILPMDDISPAELLIRADKALYMSKANPTTKVHVFNE
jgi:diguanylate cyclase (GGDEF)-like protein/PAS domain S-box-containing protein